MVCIGDVSYLSLKPETIKLKRYKAGAGTCVLIWDVCIDMERVMRENDFNG